MATTYDTSQLLEIHVPEIVPLVVPTFGTLTPPSPPDPATSPITNLVYEAYGTLVQDYLDGRISNLSDFFVRLTAVSEELRLARVAIFRKYHKTRRDLLAEEGKKNPIAMPGHVMRKLSDLTIEEKIELSEAGLKIAEQRIKESQDNVEWATQQALLSDAIRFDSHHKLQKANFEITNAMVSAALRTTAQNVERYNQILSLIEIQWKDVADQIKWQEIQVNYYVAEIKALGVVIENEGVIAQLTALAYELMAIAAKMAALRSELDLLAAEILKAAAELEVAEAEQLLADAKVITAQMEMEKSVKRLGLADHQIAETDARVERSLVELERARVNADLDRAELALSIKEKELGLLRERHEVATEEFETNMTIVRQAIPESEVVLEKLRESIIKAVSAAEIEATANTAADKVMNINLVGQHEVDGIINGADMRARIMTMTTWEQISVIQNTAYERIRIINEVSSAAVNAIMEEANLKVQAMDASSALEVAAILAAAAEKAAALKAAATAECNAIREEAEAKAAALAMTSEAQAASEIRIGGERGAAIMSRAQASLAGLAGKATAATAAAMAIQQAAERKAQSIIQGANNAANADVTSEFYYNRG